MWRFLYNTAGVHTAGFALRLASLWKPKIREGIEDRHGEKKRLSKIRSQCRPDKHRVLVHCSSAGELESAIPLMQALTAASDPDIILSIFSPSAKSRAVSVKGVAGKLYLPFDTSFRMNRMLNILEPTLVVIVKHDVWPNLVWLCRERGIKTALVNGNFRPDSSRLCPVLKNASRAVFRDLDAIYAVAEDDAERFRRVSGEGPMIEVAGDTRFDRVQQRALESRDDQGKLAEMLKGRKVAMAGSSWPEGEQRILEAWAGLHADHPDAVLILVPHEPRPERISQITTDVTGKGLQCATLTEAEQSVSIPHVLIVDRVGVLAGLYGLADIAYVGGGFGDGVHSVIEPAVFGIPVLFGPKHLMSHEARDLLDKGAAVVIRTAADIEHVFRDALSAGIDSRLRGEAARAYVDEKAGVSGPLAAKLTKLAGL